MYKKIKKIILNHNPEISILILSFISYKISAFYTNIYINWDNWWELIFANIIIGIILYLIIYPISFLIYIYIKKKLYSSKAVEKK